MKNKVLLLVMMILTTVILTGCWDSLEINERHVVLDIAIDKHQEDEKTAYYQVTYMIPDIAKLSGEDSLADNVKTAMVVTSPTMAKSIDDVEIKTQNTLTFSHTKAILLGEELLKDKKLFKGAMDSLVRNIEIGKGVNLLAVKGMAGEISETSNYQNPVVGLYIMKYFNNSDRGASYAKQQVLGSLIKEIDDTSVATLPMVASDDNGSLKIEGAAVIKDYELVGWLDKDEVRGELLVEGRVKDIPIVIQHEGNYLTYQVQKQKSNITIEDEQAIGVTIDILVNGSISDYMLEEDKKAFNEKEINDIANLLQEKVKAQVQVAVDKSQQMGVDFLGIGLQMYRQYPKLWHKYGEQWHTELYKHIPIEVNTKVIIDNTGIIQ